MSLASRPRNGREALVREHHLQARLHRYWFVFVGPNVPSIVCAGCGVTAWTIDDAMSLVRHRLFEGGDFLVKDVIEDVDVSTLDANHVLPNMAPPNLRGIWFPLGYQE